MSDAWPNDREKPSARAITERLVRIRKSAGVQFTVKSAQQKTSSKGVKGATGSTPAKPRAKATNGENGNGGGGSGGKRKRGGKGVKQENGVADDSDDGGVKVSAKEVDTLQKEASTLYGDGVGDVDHGADTGNAESGGWDEEVEMEDLESPSKRVRVQQEDLSMSESPVRGGFEDDEEDVSQYEES